MKLPEEIRATTDGLPEGALGLMTYWVAQGWSVIPLKGKEPLCENGVKDASRDPLTLAKWAKLWPWANVGGACDGKLVIDIDVRSGGIWPTDLPETKRHISGRGDGGGHLIYALTAKQQGEGLKSGAGKLGPGIDVKTGSGSYVVLPGSKHPDTGSKYSQTTSAVVHAPQELVDRIKSAKSSEDNGGMRSMLSRLLADPPSEGGRNEWLSKVCGHYAKMFRKTPDIYYQLVSDANQKLDPPLGDDEVAKTAQSIWNTETSGHPERDFESTLKSESGYLASGDYCLMALGLEGPKEATEAVPVEWADFDLRLVGILRDPETDSLTYECRMLLQRNRAEKLIHITGAEFGDARQLAKVLANLGGSISGHDRPVHKKPSDSIRLMRYVQSQQAPEMTISPCLGWNEDEQGFLTLEGVIDENGPRNFGVVRPNPELRKQQVATQEYGTAKSMAYASEILRRTCEFHDEETVAVFGAWWAANWAKHLIHQHSTMFPIMAIEAASGAGKTTGFFATMVGLSGSTAGEGHYTVPSLRNALAANRNGITWADDLDDPTSIHEMIRVLTAGGVLSKVSPDHNAVRHYQLEGSLIFSGESLQLQDQKALLERSILLSPDAPTNRKSKIPGREGKSQWSDIMELQRELRAIGGGPALAGHYVSAVLRASRDIEAALVALVGDLPSGREGERALVLHIGARILDYLMYEGDIDDEEDNPAYREIWAGNGPMAQRVVKYLEPKVADFSDLNNLDASALDGVIFNGDNTLTRKLLPAALRAFPRSDDEFRGGPVFMSGDPEDGSLEIYFNIPRLAKWWLDENRGRVDIRTESEQALNTQVVAIRDELGDSVPTVVMRTTRGAGSGNRKRFRVLKGELAQIVYARTL